ncbi:tRNA lysidine(34) synthetase TilS [Congregibacter sp.]|uniref:tRNA lysidine(34) synthetase TilS n=1 Tax=Congregibacter sp. TaxID=2744308 RepID=UPI003F6AB022
MNQDPVLQAIDQHAATLAPGTRLFVAYSGGLDSTVLLHAAAKIFDGRVTALHANHGLHGDAALWGAHCADFCSTLGVAFQTTELALENTGEGIEASARTARYRWFEACMADGGILLMAHHQDDQAETLLLRLLRGAGPEGLAGMPSTRKLGHGELLRPLLALPRRDLEAYVQAHDLSWVDDPSNSDTRFDRNYLRQELMPVIAQRWPGYRETFSRAAGLLRELNEHIPVPALATLRGSMGDPGFAIAELPSEPALAALALRRWLKGRSLLAPPSARLHEFLRQLREGTGAQLQGADWTLERYRDAVYLHPANIEGLSQEFPVSAEAPVSWSGMGLLAVEGPGEAEPLDLILRTRKGGERLALPNGQHKDLKTVFQDLAVPPWWREYVPLLLHRSASGEDLLAVANLQRSPLAISLGLKLVWKSQEITHK